MRLMVFESGFKIRSKEGCKTFLKGLGPDNELTFRGETEDFMISTDKDKNARLSSRSVHCRGDIFAPFVAVYEKGLTDEEVVANFIWEHRKVINSQILR